MKKKIIIFLIFLIIFGTITFLYSRFVGIKGLKVNEYKITNSKIPNNFHGLKLIHLTDIHYKRTLTEKKLNAIIDKINIIKPDIVVITGDLIDRDCELTKEDMKILSSILNKINVSIKKYAIRGNHDFSHEEWEKIITEGGFVNLDDDYDLIYNNGIEPILIGGMSSNLHGDKSIGEKLKPADNFLQQVTLPNNDLFVEEPNYKILIMHEPDYIDDFKYNKYDLILAGHSHNGQVKLPGIGALVLPPGAKKYYKHYYKLKNTDLYVSSGIGTSTLDVRLFNKPSFNLYRLTNK